MFSLIDTYFTNENYQQLMSTVGSVYTGWMCDPADGVVRIGQVTLIWTRCGDL